MTEAEPITLFTALMRGARNRCPNCGKGKLFVKYLKTYHECAVCGEELHHHRADDLPAYLSILILGHVLVPSIIYIEMHYHPPYWMQAAGWIPITLILCLILLHILKGMVISVEWFLGLRGFDTSKKRRLAAQVVSEPIE